MRLTFRPLETSSVFIRSGLVQSPIMEKKTGLPCRDAASTRSGLVDPGKVPVQAIRESELASEFHNGSVFSNFAGSSAAAVKKAFQLNAAAVPGELSF